VSDESEIRKLIASLPWRRWRASRGARRAGSKRCASRRTFRSRSVGASALLSCQPSRASARRSGAPGRCRSASCIAWVTTTSRSLSSSSRLASATRSACWPTSAYTAQHQRRNQGLWLPKDGDRDDFVKTDLDPMLRDVDACARCSRRTSSAARQHAAAKEVPRLDPQDARRPRGRQLSAADAGEGRARRDRWLRAKRSKAPARRTCSEEAPRRRDVPEVHGGQHRPQEGPEPHRAVARRVRRAHEVPGRVPALRSSTRSMWGGAKVQVRHQVGHARPRGNRAAPLPALLRADHASGIPAPCAHAACARIWE
jgi:hypothetical protein